MMAAGLDRGLSTVWLRDPRPAMMHEDAVKLREKLSKPQCNGINVTCIIRKTFASVKSIYVKQTKYKPV